MKVLWSKNLVCFFTFQCYKKCNVCLVELKVYLVLEQNYPRILIPKSLLLHFFGKLPSLSSFISFVAINHRYKTLTIAWNALMLQQHLTQTFTHKNLVETGECLVLWNRTHKAILPRWSVPGPSSRPTPPVTKQTQTYFPEYGLGLRRLLASDSEAVSLLFSLWWFPSFVCLPASCFFAGVQKAFTLSWGWAVRRLVLFCAETQLLWTAACKFYCVLAYFLCVTRSFCHVFSTCIQGMLYPIFALSNIILDRAMKII